MDVLVSISLIISEIKHIFKCLKAFSFPAKDFYPFSNSVIGFFLIDLQQPCSRVINCIYYNAYDTVFISEA